MTCGKLSAPHARVYRCDIYTDRDKKETLKLKPAEKMEHGCVGIRTADNVLIMKRLFISDKRTKIV